MRTEWRAFGVRARSSRVGNDADMLHPKRFEMLWEVAQAGSVSGTAVQMSYSPSAVSQQLAILERTVGVKLLLRHARSVRPHRRRSGLGRPCQRDHRRAQAGARGRRSGWHP
ncbi:MAG: LysR family transcriptional regulator [Actinobacteria bacterium]|nr:LysR family transcriptional regulator [Actinomycetota bacterium]